MVVCAVHVMWMWHILREFKNVCKLESFQQWIDIYCVAAQLAVLRAASLVVTSGILPIVSQTSHAGSDSLVF